MLNWLIVLFNITLRLLHSDINTLRHSFIPFYMRIRPSTTNSFFFGFANEILSLQWCHSRRDCRPNHQRLDCLLNCLFRHISKNTPKLRATGLCVGNSPAPGEASDAENVSIL